MKDELKTKEQLINELVEMRQRIAELKASETELKRMEEALWEREAHLQAVFEAANNISFVTMDLTGTEPHILDFSPGAERIFGYSREEVIGKPVAMLHLPEDMARVPEVLEAMCQRKSGFTGESTLVRKSGEEFPTLFTTYPILDAEGNMTATLSVSIDITERKRAEEALRESEERFGQMAELSPFPVSIITPAGRYEYVNTKFIEVFGYTLEDIPNGKEWFTQAYPDPAYRQEVISAWLSDLEQFGEYEIRPRTFSVTCKDGTVREILFRPVSMKDGRQFVIYEDITERKRAEEALQKSEERFRRLSEVAFEGIMIHEEGKIVDANQAFATMFGYDLSEVIGRNGLDFATPELRETAVRHMRTGSEEPLEGVAVRKDGSTFPVEVQGRNIPYKGRTIRVIAVRDITERKRAEETLRESEEKLRVLFEGTYDLVTLTDANATALWANPAWKNVFGEDLTRREDPFELIHPDDVDSVAQAWNTLVTKQEATRDLVYRLKGDDGVYRFFESSAYPVTIGNEPLFYVVARDITERKRAEEALRETEERFRTIVETAPSLLMISDAKGNNTYVSPNCEEIIGYTQEELQGEMRWWVHEDDTPRAKEVFDRTFREGVRGRDFEYKAVKKNGELWYASSSWEPLRGKEGKFKGVVMQTIDITERKRAEEALRESEEKFRTLVATAPDGILLTDAQGTILELNEAYAQTYGYERDEMLGKGFLEFIPHLERRARAEQMFRILHDIGSISPQEITVITKTGEQVPAELSVAVLKDDSGKVMNFIAIIRDITERKRAEQALRRRNRELALLNRAGQAFSSILDLDQVLITVLEEVRRLLDVVACSAWLIEPETEELVCRQAVGPQSEIVRDWRLALGEGLVGWVARSGESLIVPDTRADERHFKDVDRQTGLALRSIVSVPLRVKEDVIGVIQVVDTEVGRFGPADLTLLEPLATAAAIAIENARLYEQARRDAETRSVLLREVNHRVQNNLTAIIGFLYAARRRAGMEDQAVYQSIIQDLVNRVRGLSTVHSLFSASRWAPLPLSELATQVIGSSLRMLPRGKRVSVEVSPSPVRVTPDQAHNLTLVINELATNTAKHTLWERNTAHITIRIALEDDTVLFEFRDDGPGYPEAVLQLERHDVGLDLIQNIVRKGLRGELSLHNDHGAVAVIQFKATA